MFRTLAIDIVADVLDQNGKYIQPHSFKKGELLFVCKADKGLMFILGIDRYVYFREDHFLPKLDVPAQKANEIFKHFTQENKINTNFKRYNYKEFEKLDN